MDWFGSDLEPEAEPEEAEPEEAEPEEEEVDENDFNGSNRGKRDMVAEFMNCSYMKALKSEMIYQNCVVPTQINKKLYEFCDGLSTQEDKSRAGSRFKISEMEQELKTAKQRMGDVLRIQNEYERIEDLFSLSTPIKKRHYK